MSENGEDAFEETLREALKEEAEEVHQEPPPSNPGEPDQVREAYDALQDKSGKDR